MVLERYLCMSRHIVYVNFIKQALHIHDVQLGTGETLVRKKSHLLF
jgi:hypothetical protein